MPYISLVMLMDEVGGADKFKALSRFILTIGGEGSETLATALIDQLKMTAASNPIRLASSNLV
jgi:hypothetical protein